MPFGRLGAGFGRLGASSRPSSGAGPSYSAEALAVFAAFTTPPDDTRKGLINTCINTLKSNGAWSLLDTLWVLAAADNQAALINWKNPGTFNLSINGSPTFTTDRGFTGDGSAAYLSTGFTPSTAGGNLTLNSGHIGIFPVTTTANANSDIGDQASGGNVFTSIRARSGTSANIKVNRTGVTALTDGAAVPCHILGIRRDASNQKGFRNGVEIVNGAVASIALASTEINIFRTASTAAAVFTDRQIAAAHLGGALSDQQALDTYNALRTYLTAVGVS